MPHNDTGTDARAGGITAAVINPGARDRLYDQFRRTMMPRSVEAALASALQGDMRDQWHVFTAMVDTWPRLQKALAEVSRAAANAPIVIKPAAMRGEEPTPGAVEKAQLVEDVLGRLMPTPGKREINYKGLLEFLARGYFQGHSVSEIRWNADATPRAIYPVEPRFYGYPREGEDRLMLNPSGHYNGTLIDFPADKFLIGINPGHGGHPSTAAPLRSLVTWWLASHFGLKWLMQFAQLFGQPLRWATYPSGDQCAADAVCEMLETMGSSGWGAFPAGTTLDLKEASRGAAQLPQKELIEMADRQCDISILGQSLTSDVGQSGSRALGDVHETVRRDVLEGVACWAAEIIGAQLVPAIVRLNWGAEGGDDMPTVAVEWPEVEDEQAKAERDKVLFAEMGLPVARAWFYERHNVPAPEGDEELLGTRQSAPEPPSGDQGASGGDAAQADGGEADADAVEARMVSARGALGRPVVDRLTDNVLQDLSGTAAQFLGGVRPFFRRLVQQALDGEVSDEEFVAALEQASRQVPELFEDLDTAALQEALERAIGTGMLAGAGERLIDYDRQTRARARTGQTGRTGRTG